MALIRTRTFSIDLEDSSVESVIEEKTQKLIEVFKDLDSYYNVDVFQITETVIKTNYTQSGSDSQGSFDYPRSNEALVVTIYFKDLNG